MVKTNFEYTTNALVEMTIQIKRSLRLGKATKQDFEEMMSFMTVHFDALNLSPLLQGLRDNDCESEFNAYMAILNKYLGLSKELIPYELDLHDHVLADKIMGRISL